MPLLFVLGIWGVVSAFGRILSGGPGSPAHPAHRCRGSHRRRVRFGVHLLPVPGRVPNPVDLGQCHWPGRPVATRGHSKPTLPNRCAHCGGWTRVVRHGYANVAVATTAERLSAGTDPVRVVTSSSRSPSATSPDIPESERQRTANNCPVVGARRPVVLICGRKVDGLYVSTGEYENTLGHGRDLKETEADATLH